MRLKSHVTLLHQQTRRVSCLQLMLKVQLLTPLLRLRLLLPHLLRRGRCLTVFAQELRPQPSARLCHQNLRPQSG